MKAMVIGGGIGGLTTAIALRRVGVEAEVFERAPELRELGAGLGLYPNAMKALKRLGLRGAVLEAAERLRPSGQFCSWRGDVLLEISTDVMEERFGDATVLIHRAELQEVLLRALRETGGVVRLDARFVDLEQDEGGVVGRCEHGREERADVLVGADGLRSSVRERLLGDGPPRYTGYVAWRGIVEPAEEFLAGKVGFESWGWGERFGLVALGRGRAYWFATKNAPRPDEVERSAHKAELLKTFGNWHEPVPSVIGATAEAAIHLDGVYYREPAQCWGKGRTTLLGDAAHPMTPDLGQGACQAIEDAVVLADCLRDRTSDNVPAAARRYEHRRLGRTAYVVRQSLRSGKIAQLQSPLACRARDEILKAIPRRLLMRLQLRQM